MSRPMVKPEWYPLLVHKNKKNLSPEEWLYEIYNRVGFNNNLSLPKSFIHLLEPAARANLFLEKISENNLGEFLFTTVHSTPGKPIKNLSVSDAFRIVSLVKKSDWYQGQKDKEAFESAIESLAHEEELTAEQKESFIKYYDLPWHIFHEKSKDEAWYPNKDITYLSGAPTSINSGYSKEDAANQLKNLLTRWAGKLEDIELQFAHWQECNILAVFDLKMWFTLQNINYTKIGLHRLVWPITRFSKSENAYVEPHKDVKAIFELSEKIVSQEILRELMILCESRKHQKEKKSF